ncbi:hypothetical protein LAZ67_X003278 [Cordylochernes scorpioides]|uniref:Uncharacterized protein n=1 Tax=Cordylochernes scorpioides TaxID=51811 RepID=A0ABY6LWJ6_9ARAC|nr:hypothetical protein LAZ67_X003278 [Cordylochernes scorpioides]
MKPLNKLEQNIILNGNRFQNDSVTKATEDIPEEPSSDCLPLLCLLVVNHIGGSRLKISFSAWWENLATILESQCPKMTRLESGNQTFVPLGGQIRCFSLLLYTSHAQQ